MSGNGSMRRVMWFFAGLSLLSGFGCAMCASPHDCKYAAYGGIRERTNHARGRVGSIIDPALEINRVPPPGQPEPAEADTLPAPSDSPSGEELPQVAPQDTPEDPNGSPSDVAPPMELPEGPDSPDGGELPGVPEGDSIELPSEDVTLDEHHPVLQPGVTGVVPATFESAAE